MRLAAVPRAVFRSALFLGLLLTAVADGSVRRWLGLLRPGADGAVWIHGWCRRIVAALGILVEVSGSPPRDGAVVCNHLSYLDILLMSSVQPFVMVAKTEVRGWPLLGWLTAQAGTVYVQRGGGEKMHAAVNAWMATAYATGLPVLMFPEGTTTDGQGGVLSFRRGLFHSVLNEAVPLRVAAVCYALGEGNGAATVAADICWWGDATFAPHLFRFLGLRHVTCRVAFAGEVRERQDRFVLSAAAHDVVARMYAGLEQESAATTVEAEGTCLAKLA